MKRNIIPFISGQSVTFAMFALVEGIKKTFNGPALPPEKFVPIVLGWVLLLGIMAYLTWGGLRYCPEPTTPVKDADR